MDGVGAGELGGTIGEHAGVWEGALAPSLLPSSALDPVAAGLADMSVGERTWARPASRARPRRASDRWHRRVAATTTTTAGMGCGGQAACEGDGSMGSGAGGYEGPHENWIVIINVQVVTAD